MRGMLTGLSTTPSVLDACCAADDTAFTDRRSKMATAEQIQAKLNSIPIAQKNALIARAKQVNAAHRQRVQQFVDTNQKLLKADPGTVYLGGGEITMGVLIAYGLLSVTSVFVGNPSGMLTFEGHDWSYGL